MTWTAGPPEPPAIRPTLGQWLRILRRGVPVAIVIFGGLALLLAVRLVERPLCGERRPVTPAITCMVCRWTLVLMGIGWRVDGAPMQQAGAMVANHSSWLDIFALNAAARIYFVSKDEVARWPGIGWLARATGTVFIRRDRREARDHVDAFRRRLSIGHRLVFFPEGTSTDGRQVLPFKTTLFAAFLDPGLRDRVHIQPVSVIYTAPPGEAPNFYGWWGGMGFEPSLIRTLAVRRQGAIRVIYHPPLAVADYADRKLLARDLERAVRGGLDAAGIGPQAAQPPKTVP